MSWTSVTCPLVNWFLNHCHDEMVTACSDKLYRNSTSLLKNVVGFFWWFAFIGNRERVIPCMEGPPLGYWVPSCTDFRFNYKDIAQE